MLELVTTALCYVLDLEFNVYKITHPPTTLFQLQTLAPSNMSFLRTVGQPMLRQFARRTPTATPTSRRAASDYGSGAGNPVGENPQDQGKNPMEEMEHPGPPPPSVGNNNPSSEQGSSGKQQQGGSSPDKQESSKGTQGAQPKILNESPPAKGEESEEVKQHNKEMVRMYRGGPVRLQRR